MKTKLIINMLAAVVMFAQSATRAAAKPALKDVFQNDFLVGAALNPAQFCESNTAEATLVRRQFNSISPENALKWENVHPAPGRYDFAMADRYVAFGESNGMFIVGHTLIWHQQTPDWVFQDGHGQPASRALLLERMRDHIFTVMGRYKGRVKGWDVVNEALAEDGTLRNSPWRKIIGDDYVLKAYQWAHAADLQAELYYNDYALENRPKQNGALALIKRLEQEGVHITGIGLQEHDSLDWPATAQLDETISAFANLGLHVMITELDLDVLPPAKPDRSAEVSRRVAFQAGMNPYPDSLPRAMQQKLAQRYADLFAVFVKHRHSISRVTFWGVTDAGSWLNNWPVQGRTAYPLLFGRDCRPKPAFDEVITVASP